jgi:integrase
VPRGSGGRPRQPGPADGCTCRPTYYVLVRQGKRTVSQRVGRTFSLAKERLVEIQVEEDRGAIEPVRNIRFDAWADHWVDGLERKESTKRSYRVTVDLAKGVFGHKILRQVGVVDVKAFNASLRERRMTESTRAKHLRVLRKCFADAIANGYAAHNPVAKLPASEKPPTRRRESAYFEREELAALFRNLPEGLYRTLFEVALKSGARIGELLALTWGDVDLQGGVLHIRRTYTDGLVGPTKNRKKREVHVGADVVNLLGRWWGECGSPGDNVLVFPGERSGSYLNGSRVRRCLYDAMTGAGISSIGPTGEKRTVHSLRHTFAKTALENGRPMFWVSRHMGHSSYAITDQTYGHFAAAERKVQAEKLVGAFGV